MKLIFTLCLCLVLAQATPIDKLRQSARPHVAKSGGASLVEKKTAEVTSFEMEKTNDGHHVTEADAVDNLAKAEVEEAAAAATDANSKSTTPSDSSTPSSLLVKDQKKDEKKEKVEWQDAVLVEDLTKERATADANTRYIGANMKSAAVGRGAKTTQAPDPTAFLQYGPPMFYYAVHPSFLQQAQRQRSESSENVQEGARVQGWGDYGTPLYYAQDYGSYDGLGAGGSYMYGTPYQGYNPFNGWNPYIPPTFTPGQGPLQGGAGYGGAGYAGYAGYHNPYNVYSQYAPQAPPPYPVDLPSPPFIQSQ